MSADSVTSVNTAKPPDIPRNCTRKDECRLRYGPGSSTCIGWMPTYDGHGNLYNRDPNTHTRPVSCSSCGGEWIEVRCADSVEWQAVTR